MDLTIGKLYSKADFGIIGAEKQWSEFTVGGELFSFYKEDSRYHNIIEDDGFVYEGRGRYAVIPDGVQSDLHRRVFFKEEPGSSYYTYLGKGKYEKRYSDTQNKVFW